ncbi:hypothetical protein BH09ACT7_BH09ACT7_38850 [soil metagenome]
MITTATRSASTRRRALLHPTVFAPRIARRMVHELGDPADLPERVVDDAALVLGELVTESIRQSRRDVEVDVQLRNQQITLRVRDAHARAPLFDGEIENAPARSSATVQHLAASWGCCRYERGWEVWAVLSAPQLVSAHTSGRTTKERTLCLES